MEHNRPCSSAAKLRVTFLGSEWKSSKGGLSTVNRELAINVAKHPEVEVTFFVPQCSDKDKEAARGHNINLVEAGELTGMDELTWLMFPPKDLQIDVVVGHGVKLGRQAQIIRGSHNCKWVQVVHTAPEELGMYKAYSNPLSVNEKKHKVEVRLCEIADFVVTVGPKLTEAFRTYLRPSGKDQMVFEFTPGVLTEFSEVEQAVDERKLFQVLVFGRGDNEDFELKGFDIAAKAVASLNDTHLTFVGARDGKQEEIKNRLLECRIPARSLTVRGFIESRESLQKLFCEMDLAIMPSRTEGFGLTGLEALSAGLPILVSGNSGFGVALCDIPFGSLFVIDSEDSEVWAKAIKDVRHKDRKKRLKESKLLRASYKEEYSWGNQTKLLISKMVTMTKDSSVASANSARRTVMTQQTEASTEGHPGTITITIKMHSVTFQNGNSGDPEQRKEAKWLIMQEMTKRFMETHAAKVQAEDYPLCLHYYLNGVRDVIVRAVFEGSLHITVECRTLEILEGLWEDYCSGHLNAEAEERLLTDDIKERFDVESVKLETTILKEDYVACKLFLLDISKVNQDSSLKEEELLPQDHTQATDESQTQTTEEPEPVTVHFAANYRGKGTDTQTENSAKEEEEAEQERKQSLSEDSPMRETSHGPIDELPEYFQHLKLTPIEGSEDNLRIAVTCNNLEDLERLWEDYRSGYLNAIAEEYLMTDDIKERFHVESVKLATTIQEEDYLACKEFFSSKPQNDGGSTKNSSEQISTVVTEGTLTQFAKETHTQIAVISETLTSDLFQPVEEIHDQIVDESKPLILGNAHIPSSNETRNLTVKGTEIKAIAETQILSTEETMKTQISSAEQTQTQTCAEGSNLARDENQIQSTELTRTQTAEYSKDWRTTKYSQVRFPEENRSPNTEGHEHRMLKEEEPDSDMEVDAQPPKWQQVVDKKVLKRLKGKEIKRQEFIHELIDTERTHVRNLKVLNKVFYRPMVKMNVMSRQYINQLFPNLDALIKIHVSLMKSMMKRREESVEVIVCIGDVMLERFDGEPGEVAKDACAEFCNHQKFALEQLKNRQRKDLKLQQFLNNCENHPLCRRLRLQDIISSSYQRLTKYPMLLEGIQKNTPSSHSDGKNIERAIQCTKDLLAFVNQSVKDCEDKQRLEDFQRKIDRRPLESTNNKMMEEFKNLDLTTKKLVYDGPLTWRISRTKCIDLHVLLLEDLIILLQRQDDKLVLKCLSTTFSAGYQDVKTTHSPIIKLNGVFARNVATDKRAFFLVSTSSSVGPQIYELVTATVTDRKNWYKYITDTAEAYKGRERGRRCAVSVIGPRTPGMDLGDLTELPNRLVNSSTKEEEPVKEEKQTEGDLKVDEEDTAKETDADDDESDAADDEKERAQDQGDEETESEAPTVQEEVAVPTIIEPTVEQESQVESESEPESELETETEVTEKEEVKEEVEVQSESPAKLESSPPSDSETEVLSAGDSEAPSSSPLNRAALAELTNEESVDERCPSLNRNSMTSESSSSSSSNDTLKIRASYVHMSVDEQDDALSSHSPRSSVMLLELLRSKDNDLRKVLDEKSKLVAELRSHVNGDSVEARDLILAAILQAIRLTVAVSDVLNLNIDMARGVGALGYGTSQGDFSSEQQLVSSTSVLNEQLTTVLEVITERDMARERLQCDLQYANSQIRRLKQGRSSSRHTRELPGSQFPVNDDNFSGFSDSPRRSSPTSTVDLDSDYARLSETSDYLASEDNMASSGYRSSTASWRHTWRSRDESTSQFRRGGRSNNRAYWSEDGAEYESQSQI